MRKSFVFLFVFIFLTAKCSNLRNIETDKPQKEDSVSLDTVPKMLQKDTIVWNVANASFYNSKDPSQTKKRADGIGASGRRIRSGSIAFGSPATKNFIKNKIVYIEIKDCNIVTPYGKGIFRVDDSMNKRFNREDKFFIDFHHKDLTSKQKRMGRFNIEFRVYKIETAKNNS